MFGTNSLQLSIIDPLLIMSFFLLVLFFVSSSFMSIMVEPETPKTRSSEEPDTPVELITQMLVRYEQKCVHPFNL